MLEQQPPRLVLMKYKGNLKMTYQYKLERRPEKTSLAIIDSNFSWILGGGGAWKYETQENGTLWTQTNTIILKNGCLPALLKPFFHSRMLKGTINAMELAKKILEKE